METNIQIFSSPQFGQIRTAGTSEQPLFCLADVCKPLGLEQISRVKNQIDDDGVTISKVIDALGREQEATFISESGLYQVIFQSRKPEAKLFRKWVTSEVLPAIRNYGGYLTPQKVEEALTNPDFLIQLATNLKEEQMKRKVAESKALLYQSITEEQAPKVLFANAVETSKQSCLIADLAKVLRQNGVEIGQNRLFGWLRQKGYLCSKGEFYNTPTQKSMEQGLLDVKKGTVINPDGSVRVTSTTKVTGKGQVYFVNKFLNQKITA